MIKADILNLGDFCKALGEDIPQQLSWFKRGSVVSGRLIGTNVQIAVGRSGNFAKVICRGFSQRVPTATAALDLTSVMLGPARLTRTVRGANQLESSWPMILTTRKQAELFATDLLTVLNSGGTKPDLIQMSSDVKHRFKSIVASNDGFIEVPTKSDCSSFDFIAGKNRAAKQFCVYKTSRSVLSVSTLVTNWQADLLRTSKATSTLILDINKRLRWTRLVRRGTAIESQVTMATDAITHQTWNFASCALRQAVEYCRDSLRVIQKPEVAKVFEETCHRRLDNLEQKYRQ